MGRDVPDGRMPLREDGRRVSRRTDSIPAPLSSIKSGVYLLNTTSVRLCGVKFFKVMIWR